MNSKGSIMRLTSQQIETIRQSAHSLVGEQVAVRLFGSRVDDQKKGGDIDLLLEFNTPVENPALTAARISAKVSGKMQGRKVDVLLSAHNLLRLPIHDVAFQQGQLL